VVLAILYDGGFTGFEWKGSDLYANHFLILSSPQLTVWAADDDQSGI
jgi:hypothetical protein